MAKKTKKKVPPKKKKRPAEIIEPPKREPILAEPPEYPDRSPVPGMPLSGNVPAGNKSTLEPPAEPEAGEEASTEFLRFSAGLYYTTDFNGTTVKAMSEHPIYGSVKYSTLQRWCTDDQWVRRREENLNRWRRAIESKITNKLVQARIEQMKKLRGIFDKAVEKLENDVVEAKSWEGILRALVQLTDLMNHYEEKTIGAILPDVAAPETTVSVPATRPQLTDDEARAAAKTIMATRRRKMREESRSELEERRSTSLVRQQPKFEVIDGKKS